MIINPYLVSAAVPSTWNSFLASLAPVAWYKLQEASGTNAADSSGNSRNATYPGSGINFSQASGFTQVGNGVTHTSAGSVFTQRAHDTGFDITGDVTVLAVTKISASHGNFPKLVWQATNATTGLGTFLLQQDYSTLSGKFTFRITIGGVNKNISCNTIPVVGNTYVVIGRRSGTNLDIFINGIKEATLAGVIGTADVASLALMIGGSGNSDGNNSVLSNVAVFNKALSDSDIATLFSLRGIPTVTWNASDKQAQVALSNGNLTATPGASTAYGLVRATDSRAKGKWYFEVHCDTTGASAFAVIGVCASTTILTNYPGQDVNGWGYYQQTGQTFHNAVAATYGASYASGDVIGCAFDMDAGKIWWSKNGVWQNSGDPASATAPAYTGLAGAMYPAIGVYMPNGGAFTARFKSADFTNTPPAGFSAFGS